MKNYNNKLICIDLDGTLCNGKFREETPTPITERIKYINENLYQKGAHIIIYTARAPEYYAETLAWLIANGVKHH
jgi:hydroxymethylpyrimidine pyrophosphatase-like HAD family hydrolase